MSMANIGPARNFWRAEESRKGAKAKIFDQNVPGEVMPLDVAARIELSPLPASFLRFL
jgi:hypothetical protein